METRNSKTMVDQRGERRREAAEGKAVVREAPVQTVDEALSDPIGEGPEEPEAETGVLSLAWARWPGRAGRPGWAK